MKINWDLLLLYLCIINMILNVFTFNLEAFFGWTVASIGSYRLFALSESDVGVKE